MKKKLLSLFLAGTLVFTMSGCGLGSGESSGTSEDENTLTVWCWDQDSYVRSMEDALTVYQEDHPNVSLEISEYSWEQIQEKLDTAADSGDTEPLPDIVLIKDAYLMDEDAVEDPESLFVDLAVSDIDFSQFDAAKAQQTQRDGIQYGLPFDLGTAVLCVRTDILSKAELTVDDFTDITWERFLELSKTVKERTGLAMLAATREGDLRSWMPEEIYTQMKDSGALIEVESRDQYLSAVLGEETAAVLDSYDVFADLMAGSVGTGNWAATTVPAAEALTARDII